MRKAQKKIAEENLKQAVKIALETAEAAASEGKSFCISHVEVGLDAAAVREAVLKVIEQKVVWFFLPLWLSLSMCLLFIFSFYIPMRQKLKPSWCTGNIGYGIQYRCNNKQGCGVCRLT